MIHMSEIVKQFFNLNGHMHVHVSVEIQKLVKNS